MFCFGEQRRPRRPSLTPMIDVVFLLLVFFMLASQFGHDKALPIVSGGGAANYDGPPRLLEISPEALALNGVPVAVPDLARRLSALTNSPDDIIILRPDAGASLQRLIDVAETLNRAGFARLAVVE
ncbi:biopolymer transporter ExbD [Pseudorhodobacter sp.]|uniref:ExbD/TolR family protein n=1 Tax=Pseudorhodobacter sp. TaxID=1934400 RepID=UPI002AFF6167|nr:biopolymer transporter ExbD [Pseudorhodobacter sp.]